MSETQLGRQPESSTAVRLLYVCDFPPSNLGGGPILMSRLLTGYPPDALTVLTSTRYAKVSPHDGRVVCEEITLPLSNGHGRFGLGHLRVALNWLRIPLIAATVRRIIRQRKVGAVLTILHGHFCFGAALAASLSGIPYIVVVHDDYSTQMNLLGRCLTRAVLTNGARIYCVSPGMQRTIREQFGTESELQLPAAERHHFEPLRMQSDELSIVYAGSVTGAVEDTLKTLGNLIVSGKLKECGIKNAKLHLYTVVNEEQKRAWGWDHPDIVVHPWVRQNELPQVLRKADVLFLPFSFAPGEKHIVETSFPSKTADYLASGTPIVVFGPTYSSLVVYAREQGFAEIVTREDPDLLASAIARIALDANHRQALSSHALSVFSQHHDINQQRKQFLQMLSSIVEERERSGEGARPGI